MNKKRLTNIILILFILSFITKYILKNDFIVDSILVINFFLVIILTFKIKDRN